MSGLIDDFLGGDDFQQEQIDILKTQLEEHQEKYNELGNADTPETNQMREQLANAMHQIEINIQQTQDAQAQRIEQENDEAEAEEQGGQDIGFFND